MNDRIGATLRMLIPAFAVAGVLALSFLAPPQLLGSTSGVGYGYANNCGVKGDGFHDHGKVCPNRPFPGHGTGVLRIMGISITESESTVNNNGHVKTEGGSQVTATEGSATSPPEEGDDSSRSVSVHGH